MYASQHGLKNLYEKIMAKYDICEANSTIDINEIHYYHNNFAMLESK